MTDYEMKVTAGDNTVGLFNRWGTATDGKRVYIGNSAILSNNVDIKCDELIVGMNGTTLANETATLRLAAPYNVKITDQPATVRDPRILWANSQGREVNRGAGVKIEDLSGNDNHAARGTGVFEDGPTHVQSTNLKLWYDMQTLLLSGAYKMQDMSGTANHGTINGRVFDADGKYFRGRRFKGTSGGNNIAAADNPGLSFTTAFTIGCWFKLDSQPAAAGIFSLIDKAGSYGMGYQDSGTIYVYTTVAAVKRTDTNVIGVLATGLWHQFIFKYDGANHTVYFDGNKIGMGARSGTVDDTANAFIVGASGASGNADFFDGVLDDVFAYSVALTDAEAAILVGPHTVTTVPRGKSWNFDGTVNATITITDANILHSQKPAFCCFATVNNLASSRGIAMKGSATNDSWQFWVTTANKFVVDIYIDNITQAVEFRSVSLTMPVGGTPTHIGFTYDGTAVTFIKDGTTERITQDVSAPSAYTPQEMLIGTGNSSNITIGSAGALATSLWNGTMSDMFLFDNIPAADMIAFFTASPMRPWGVKLTETGTIEQYVFPADTTEWPETGPLSDKLPGIVSQAENPRRPFPMFIQGTGFTATKYRLKGQSPAITLQTTTTGLKEDYSIHFEPMQPLVIDDTGGFKPISTSISRRGNISRVKKVGYMPRKIVYTLRININSPSGLNLLRRLQDLATTSYQEIHQFNLVTDKHILVGYQLTSYDENPVQAAPWKIIDVVLEFTSRNLS